jgi:hypothetical protein
VRKGGGGNIFIEEYIALYSSVTYNRGIQFGTEEYKTTYSLTLYSMVVSSVNQGI